jgi:hypothetical protein
MCQDIGHTFDSKVQSFDDSIDDRRNSRPNA